MDGECHYSVTQQPGTCNPLWGGEAGKGFPGTRFVLSASLHRFSSPVNPLLFQEGPFKALPALSPTEGQRRGGGGVKMGAKGVSGGGGGRGAGKGWTQNSHSSSLGRRELSIHSRAGDSLPTRTAMGGHEWARTPLPRSAGCQVGPTPH